LSEALKTALAGAARILVSVWLGAALFFSAVVAPAVFGVLRGFDLANANEIAGTIVTRALGVINVSGFVIGASILSLMLIAEGNRLRPRSLIACGALAIVTIATAAGHWVIAAKMRALRAAMGVIDLVAPDDPRRVAFGDLHHYSVLALGIAMVAGLLAVIAMKPRLDR